MTINIIKSEKGWTKEAKEHKLNPNAWPCTATEYEQQVQGLQGDVSKLTDELEEAGEALRNVLAENERKGLTNPFITLVGMKGDEYSQDMVELGLKMMSRSLSSQQAHGVMVDYGTSVYPQLTSGVDYRVPSASQFRKWRRLLLPIYMQMACADSNR